jgi:hypothetical protein
VADLEFFCGESVSAQSIIELASQFLPASPSHVFFCMSICPSAPGAATHRTLLSMRTNSGHVQPSSQHNRADSLFRFFTAAD